MKAIHTLFGKSTRICTTIGFKIVFSLAMLVMAVSMELQAQVSEGFYYIANKSSKVDNVANAGAYSSSTPSTNFYLCPAIGCYYDNNVDQPHLTTYRTNQDQNSLWKIEAVSGETNCYYLIHYKTGKYLKSNETPNYNIDNGKNRKVVHLEEKTDDDDSFKFYIKNNSGTYQIYPKVYKPGGTLTDASSMSLNVKGDQWTCYVPWNGISNGIIGLFTYSGQAGSQWALESFSSTMPCATPSIKYVDDNNINISYPYSGETGLTIYYTTDGTAPTTSSSSNASTSFNISASGVVKIRAFAAKTGYANSDEAVLWGSAQPFLIQSKEDANYYLVPSGNGTNVNTSSMAGEPMQWTLQNAGSSTGGVPYYYLVNSNGNKIKYNSSDNTLTLNSESEDANKFCIIEDGNSGEFFIIPATGASTGTNYTCRAIFKNNGNVASDNATAQEIKANSDDNINRLHWKLRLCNEDDDQKNLFANPPFTASDDNETHYYYIQNVGNAGYYIILPSTDDGYVTTSNSSSDYASSPWLFKFASSDNWLTYYYVINAATGKYMHFNIDNGKTGDQANVISMKDISEKNAANEERFQFIMVRSTTTDACYIVPKGYANNFNQSKYFGLWESNPDALKSTWSRSSSVNNVKWTFSEATINSLYLDPVVSQDELGNITFTHPTNACDYYYTTDGTYDPTVPASSETAPTAPTYKYTGAFLPEVGVTQIRVKAVSKGNYGVTSNVVTYNLSPLTQPTISFDNTTNTVTISSLSGATIYYTFGTTEPIADPTVNESVAHGTSPVSFTISEKTYVKALAVKGGFTTSAVQSHVIDKVATPSRSVTPDNKVTLTCATSGVTFYYTIGDTDPADPTTASTRYTSPIENASGKYIKVIAVKAGWITSDVYSSGLIRLQCATPVIKRETGDKFSISCAYPAEGVSIYYTTGSTTPADPTASSNLYSGPVSISSYPIIVKAIAIADGYDNSNIAEKTISEELTPEDGYYEIASAGDFALFVTLANTSAGAAYSYRVTDDFTVSSSTAITQAFTGTFDGSYHTISGLTKPLFNSISGGTVKNVILENANISSGNENGNEGAICHEAEGTAKIYNCGVLSGSVSGGTNVGGLVGLIKSGSSVRVVNCYNYADVSGSDYAAGIVGKNEGTVDGATTLTGSGVRIAMCMMYGSVSSATNISPVYTGNHVDNVSKFTEYNYYLYSNERDALGNIIVKIPYTAYNDQQAIAKEEYLTRFPFYRHILNTHRELASYFLFSDYAHVDEIGHWAIKPGRDYPIVEQWEKDTQRTTIDIKDNLPNTTNDYAGKLLTGMGTGGYLTVNVSINGSSFTSQLPITDMDTLRYDYTYGKVVLPFANEYSGWTRDYDYICTGWKITNAGGATSFSAPNHDYADRSNKQKDIYDASANPYVFAQGGYYIVPDGVTSINIEANFAKAYYLSDEYYDIGYGTSYNGTGAGLGGPVPLTYHGKSVYTNLSTLLSAMDEAKNPNSQAIALVGNFHYNVAALGGVIFNSHTSKALTIMSVDEDNNQEPDYGWYTYMNDQSRPDVPALRFDFVPNIGIGMAAHVKGSSYYPNISIWKAHGWFELTETALSLMNQCEIDSRNFPEQSADGNTNRWIVNSGYFTQIVRSYNNPCDRLRFIQIGGNAYVKEFYPGNHSTKSHTNPIVPINVTGGEIEECCMTGYHVGGKAKGDNIWFWCAGGKIHKFLGAYMETPINSSDKQENVNMTAKVDHALISKFFGGGTSPAARITGNISVTINNSKVDFYCGGPEFGDMATGKTVTTSATNTVFNNFYGAGFGGTSLTYVYQNENSGYAMGVEVEYDRPFTNYTGNDNRLSYNATYGIGTSYKFEFIPNSVGQKVVARIYLGRSQFSLASTGSVENTLNNCTVEEDFYGAGCQGTVNGNVVSNLTDCKIKGNAYGGGYKAESNKLPVYPITKPTYSKYYGETGIFSEFGKVEPEEWEWVQGTSTDKNKAVESEKKLYTDEVTKINMADLGNVTGNISITIGGDSKIGTDGDSTTGSVYGGGNESKSLANTTVTLKGNTEVLGDVFGGGNRGVVEGSARVDIKE